MKSSLLALLMLSLLAPPAFAHGSHDDDVPPATEEQNVDAAPSAPAPAPPAAKPAEGGAKQEPAADSQAAPKAAQPDKEP